MQQEIVHPNLGTITVQVDGNDVWVLVSQLGGILGYSNVKQAVKACVKPKDIALLPVSTAGGMQDAMFIKMPGVTRLIMNSAKATALPFKEWLFLEVLPSIINNGGYIKNLEEFVDARMTFPNIDARNTMISLLQTGVPHEEIERTFYSADVLAGMIGFPEETFWNILVRMGLCVTESPNVAGEIMVTLAPEFIADYSSEISRIDDTYHFTKLIAYKVAGYDYD